MEWASRMFVRKPIGLPVRRKQNLRDAHANGPRTRRSLQSDAQSACGPLPSVRQISARQASGLDLRWTGKAFARNLSSSSLLAERTKICERRAGAAGTCRETGASSTIIWQLVPLEPKELTAASRGFPSKSCQSMPVDGMMAGIASREISGFNCLK